MVNDTRYLSSVFNSNAHEIVGQVIDILRADHAAYIAPRLVNGLPTVFYGNDPECRDGLGMILAHTWLQNYNAANPNSLGTDAKELLAEAQKVVDTLPHPLP